MRSIGFSTGALALADYRRGIQLLLERNIHTVEVSALRESEVHPLLSNLKETDVCRFTYVSFHAPSSFKENNEDAIVCELRWVVERKWPVIVHPDAICDFSKWRPLGKLLLVENMDKRKHGGRTSAELAEVFEKLPEAGLCFDIGHARQVDPTMSEAAKILKEHGKRLKQIHISDVNTQNRHDPLTFGAIKAYRQIAHLIPQGVPVILESRLQDPSDIVLEISRAEEALLPEDSITRLPVRRLAAGSVAGD